MSGAVLESPGNGRVLSPYASRILHAMLLKPHCGASGTPCTGGKAVSRAGPEHLLSSLQAAGGPVFPLREEGIQ